MRKRAIAGSILASFGILTVGWQIGAATAGTTQTTTTSGDSGYGSAASALKDGTYTGTSEQTRFGNVQVSVVISGGKIADVTALHLTDAEGRSVQISNYAAPILRQEVLASQSAKVSNVSGATYTTEGYLGSLQSALDQAAS